MALMNFLKKVQNVVDTVSTVVQQVQNISESPAAEPRIPTSAPVTDGYSFHGSVDDYIAQLIAARFPQLRVFRNQQLAGNQNVPVSFLLYQDGEPKLAVILCGSQEYRTRRVQNTVDACIARNIPVQRYYRDFRNKASYVVNRIQSAL